MGSCETGVFSNDFVLNGLLPDKAQSVTRALDGDRWLLAEERITQLIAHIQPNESSERFRHAVTCYVKCLIMKCFSCQVFTYGSVPLKTYLPEGDIDLSIFSEDQNLKDTWADEVKDMLENAQKNRDAEFHIKEIQYIQAEVKIIKCLIQNIVVDISFNQHGGLRKLSFLEAVDRLINQNHLFKCSVILIKAWCYYESRTLGAHHGLISTYALEIMVLYIFHVFNSSFAGPLEVLYRFLEFFRKFDWNEYALGLWGPVPLGLIHEKRVEPSRKDRMTLLLSRPFHDACLSVYAVMPDSFQRRERQFIAKHLNIIDPLCHSNNLGRSVSKGNFFRIRSAFNVGAKQLAKLLDCPHKNLIEEVDLFFKNTWDIHCKDHDPDAVCSELFQSIALDKSKSRHCKHYSNSEEAIEKSEQHKSNQGVARPVDTSNDLSSCQQNCFPGDMLSAANESALPWPPMNRKTTPESYCHFYPPCLQIPLRTIHPYPWYGPFSFHTNNNLPIQRPQVAVVPIQPSHGYYQVEKDSTKTEREKALWQYGKNNLGDSQYDSAIFPFSMPSETANPDHLSSSGPPFPSFALPYLQDTTMTYEYSRNWFSFEKTHPVRFSGTIKGTHQFGTINK